MTFQEFDDNNVGANIAKTPNDLNLLLHNSRLSMINESTGDYNQITKNDGESKPAPTYFEDMYTLAQDSKGNLGGHISQIATLNESLNTSIVQYLGDKSDIRRTVPEATVQGNIDTFNLYGELGSYYNQYLNDIKTNNVNPEKIASNKYFDASGQLGNAITTSCVDIDACKDSCTTSCKKTNDCIGFNSEYNIMNNNSTCLLYNTKPIVGSGPEDSENSYLMYGESGNTGIDNFNNTLNTVNVGIDAEIRNISAVSQSIQNQMVDNDVLATQSGKLFNAMTEIEHAKNEIVHDINRTEESLEKITWNSLIYFFMSVIIICIVLYYLLSIGAINKYLFKNFILFVIALIAFKLDTILALLLIMLYLFKLLN
jgi:hypothetical protein